MKAFIFVALVALPIQAARIFVTSERAGTVTMIDGAAMKTIAVGTRPRGVVISPDGKRLYVAVSHFRGQFSKTADGVVAIDPSTLTIIRRYKAARIPRASLLHRTASGSVWRTRTPAPHRSSTPAAEETFRSSPGLNPRESRRAMTGR